MPESATDKAPSAAVYHLELAKKNGATETEPEGDAQAAADIDHSGVLVEAITHLAFYAGWPKARSAIAGLETD
jgi:alkylhydroperoxidase/carboxymuconolactone decarboxylase family protein YurZ